MNKKNCAMLDTSICIDIMRGNTLPKHLRSYQFIISSIVESELWTGVFYKGGIREKQKVEMLISAVEVRDFDSKCSKKAGEILATLSKKGLRIGDFDTLIAAHALALNVPLVSKNPKHFNRIPDIEIVSI